MTHTPGPYRIEYDTRIEYGPVVAGEGFCVAKIMRGPPEWRDNARLFAAAPETAAERDRLKSANEHWHVRVTALKADVAVSLAERDRLKAIKGDLVAALEAITDIFEKTGPMPSAIAQQARTTLAKAQKEPSV